MPFYEIVGLSGVALMLLAYGLLMSGRMGSDRAAFHGLNLAGALMVLYSLMFDFNLPTVVIELAWSGVAIYGLWRLWCKRTS